MAGQESLVSISFLIALRSHKFLSSVDGLMIQKFHFEGSAFLVKYWPKLMAHVFK